MKMKKNFIRVLAVCIACVCLSVFPAYIGQAAEMVNVNIASMEGAVPHWSGTWGNNQQDAAAGDPGSNCFNGNYGDKWGSHELTAEIPQWISIVFPSAQEISGFKVWQADTPYTDNQGFTVEVQNGTDTWTTVLNVTASDLNTSAGKWKTFEKDFDTAVTATAFRIYVTSEQKGSVSAVELSELEIYKKEERRAGEGAGNTGKAFDRATKAALDLSGAAASASSENQPAQNAIDSSIDTKWGSSGNFVPQWIQIKLPEIKNLAGFVLQQDYYWSDVTDMTVEVAADGGWETVYTMTDGCLNELFEIDFDTLWNTDTIRFTFHQVGDSCKREEGGAPTTSIDMKEILLYTAEAVGAQPQPTVPDPTIPATGEQREIVSFLTAFFMAGAAAVLIAVVRKKRTEQ